MTSYDGSSSQEIVACQSLSLKVCLKMKGFINQANSFQKKSAGSAFRGNQMFRTHCVTISQQIDWSCCPCMSIIPMLSMGKRVDLCSASFNHPLSRMYSLRQLNIYLIPLYRGRPWNVRHQRTASEFEGDEFSSLKGPRYQSSSLLRRDPCLKNLLELCFV